MSRSQALEANLRQSRVEVQIDPRFEPLRRIVSGYHGLLHGLDVLLLEICHPYRNWELVIAESRRFALQQFRLFLDHPDGPEGVRLLSGIFIDAVHEVRREATRAEALDALVVYAKTILEESGDRTARFLPVVAGCFTALAGLPEDRFRLVVFSFYRLQTLGAAFAARAEDAAALDPPLRLTVRYLDAAYAYWLSEPDPREWFLSAVGGAPAGPGLDAAFEPVSTNASPTCGRRLALLAETASPGRPLPGPPGLPGCRDIVDMYERLPQEVARAGGPPATRTAGGCCSCFMSWDCPAWHPSTNGPSGT